MYTLHYAPDNASLIIRLVLEEAGLPYRTALVDRATRAQDSAAYRALNPAGLIPALETPDGPIFETAAILLWLSDTHGLGPAPGASTRGDLLKWLFFISNTAHADLRQIFYPELYVPPEAEDAHYALLSARMHGHLSLLDQAATENPALFSETSILTAYIITLMRWLILYPRKRNSWMRLADYPSLATLAQALESRPAALRCAEIEGLGPSPFTAPTLATPAEGSAT